MNCLDSTFLIDFLDPSRDAHDAASDWMEANAEEPMYTPSFVRWEVLRGAARLDGVEGVERLVNELEWLVLLAFSEAAATETVLIEAELRERGDEISAADYPIAETARNAGALVVTADPDFERVPGLEVDRYDRTTGAVNGR